MNSKARTMWFRPSVSSLVVVTGLGAQACESSYTLPATFCDDWCRISVNAGCERSPSSCVSECETAPVPTSCADERRSLLSCYEQTSSEHFVCVDRDTRVTGGACAEKRDAFYGCVQPGIEGCLSLCRVFQAAPPASADADCVLLQQPCESVCFALAGLDPNLLAGGGSGSGGRSRDAGVSLLPLDAGNGSAALPDIVSDLTERCLVDDAASH